MIRINYLLIGSSTSILAPFLLPDLLEATIEPPWSSIIFFTIFSPKPECSPNFSGLLL